MLGLSTEAYLETCKTSLMDSSPKIVYTWDKEFNNRQVNFVEDNL